MKVCITDDCLIEGLALPNWFHVCPVCGYTTWNLEEILKSMKETPIPIEFVDKVDLDRMISMLHSNQENWDDKDWEFVWEMQNKYRGS
jgi:hypothetical protein